MKTSPSRALLIGAMVLTSPCASAAPHSYSYTLIAVPNAVQTNAVGINKAGTVLGNWLDQYGNKSGFVYRGGSITSFAVPHAVNTIPAGISDAGDIAGTYQDAFYNTHGFTYSAKGVFTTVDFPGSAYTGLNGYSKNGIAAGEGLDGSSKLEMFTYTKGVFTTAIDGNTPIAAAVNAQGSVAGTFEPPDTAETAFLYAGGQVTTITIPNANFAQSYAINNKNVVVGQAATAQGAKLGFRYNNGKIAVFGPKGATNCIFLGINDQDAIAGVNFGSNGDSTGLVYDKGDFSTLAIAGKSNIAAIAINDGGRVVGGYSDVGGPKVFLATPTK